MVGFDNPTGDRLMTMSDIIPQEVFGLNLIKSFGDKLSSKIVDDWINRHLLLRISRMRIGRKEIIMLLAGIRQAEERRGKKGIGDLFSGLKIIGFAPIGFMGFLNSLNPIFILSGLLGIVGISLLIRKMMIVNANKV